MDEGRNLNQNQEPSDNLGSSPPGKELKSPNCVQGGVCVQEGIPTLSTDTTPKEIWTGGCELLVLQVYAVSERPGTVLHTAH